MEVWQVNAEEGFDLEVLTDPQIPWCSPGQMSPFLTPGAEALEGKGAPTNHPALEAHLLKFHPHWSIYPEATAKKATRDFLGEDE